MRRRLVPLPLFAAMFAVGGLAPPASAISIRVDFMSTVETMWGDHVDITGSFGTFDVPSFPAVVPLTVPFSLLATDFGPGYVDTIYEFSSAGGLGFSFAAADSGQLVAIASPGRTRTGFELCYPTHCSAIETFYVQILRNEIQLSHGTHVGGDSGEAPLVFELTVVPELSTASLIGVGILLLHGRRRH